jgi:hypothetical protein
MDIKYCDNCGDVISDGYRKPRIKITVTNIGDYSFDNNYYPDLCQKCLEKLLADVFVHLPKLKDDWAKYKKGKTAKF